MAFSVEYGDAVTYFGDVVLNSLGTNGAVYGKLCRNVIKGINRKDIKDMIDARKNMPIGEIIETQAGDLNCKHVIHIVTPFKKQDDNKCTALRNAYKSVIELAIKRGYKTIGLPFIGTGANGYSDKEVYDVLIDLLSEISEQEESEEKEIINATIIAYLSPEPIAKKQAQCRREFVLNQEISHELVGKHDEKYMQKVKNEYNDPHSIYAIASFMGDIYPEDMFFPIYPPNQNGYFKHFDFIWDYCNQKDINHKKALKEYECHKRQKVSMQYTLSKLDVYRFTVLLNLNKSEFVTFMTICGHMPCPDSKLDMFFMDYMNGLYGDPRKQHTLLDMDKLFRLQDGIQFTIIGSKYTKQALSYAQA